MEEVVLPPVASGASFEKSRVRQFTVFLENRVGRLTALVRTLEHSVGLCAISIEESADAALVRVICPNPDEGREKLRESGFSFSMTDVLAVELPEGASEPLLSLCTAILSAEINVHYAYPLMSRPRGPAIVLYVEDPTLAARILIRRGFRILSEADLKAM